MKKMDKPVVVEEIFKASLQEVWYAITEAKQMKQWFFVNIDSFEPRVGFETSFIVKNDKKVFPHLWKITEAEPMKKIVYNWKYGGYNGDSFVTIELTSKGNLTALKLTHQVVEDFPSDVTEFTRESCMNGWNYFIKQNLKEYLEKRE